MSFLTFISQKRPKRHKSAKDTLSFLCPVYSLNKTYFTLKDHKRHNCLFQDLFTFKKSIKKCIKLTERPQKAYKLQQFEYIRSAGTHVEYNIVVDSFVRPHNPYFRPF